MNELSHKISFIIASVDQNHKLQQCIASIERAYERSPGMDIEILVVFQGIEEGAGIKINHPELVNFYYLKERGLSLARNFAIKRSSGAYLVFLDDDAAIKEDFLAILLENISNPAAGAFCGRIIDPVSNVFYSKCFLCLNSKSLNRFEFMYFMGSAHILKKTAIGKIGLYDERFGAGAKYPAAEETDLFFRLKRSNEEVIYLPDLIFFHHINNVTPAFKRFNYCYALGAMLAKHISSDTRNLCIYLYILWGIVAKSFLRTLQVSFFPTKEIEAKNLRFRFESVLAGTLKGVWDYTWNL